MQQSGLGVRDYVSTVEQAVKAYSGGTTWDEVDTDLLYPYIKTF